MRSFARLAVALCTLPLALALVVPATQAAESTGRSKPDTEMVPRGVPVRTESAHVRPADDRTARSGSTGTEREPGTPLTPSSALHFDAIPRIGGNWPADPTGAIGDSWFLTAVNTSYALYDLTGTLVVGPDSFEPFFSYPSGTIVYDPKVVYDQYQRTFVLAFLAVNDAEQRSWIVVVAVPDATANDQTTWCATRILGDRVKGDGRQWADYPGLGYTTDRIAVTTNQFDWKTGDLDYAQIISWPKTSVYDCTQPVEFDTFVGADTLNPDGTAATTIQPAQSVGASPVKQYFLSFHQDRRDSFIVVWRLAEAARGLKLSKAALKVPDVSVAPYGTQGGGKIEGPGSFTTWWDTGDMRLVNAWYDADLGTVYAAHAVAMDLGPDPITHGYLESVVRWYEIAPARKLGASSVLRKGTVGTPETDAGWPVVGTDASGNLFITYSRASAVTDEFLSAWAAEIGPGQTKADLLLLAAGQARAEAVKGPEHWGDFNGISRDPLTGAMAMVNQYALSDGSGSTRDWQQTVDVVGEAV